MGNSSKELGFPRIYYSTDRKSSLWYYDNNEWSYGGCMVSKGIV